MDWRETIKISKVDAARRQIDTAVRLYFDDGDPVSIHTLAAAALGVLQGLDKHGANTGTIYDFISNCLPEFSEFISKTLRTPQNFFKHADLDPQATLEFSLREAEILLFEACRKFSDLAGRRGAEMGVFIIWIIVQNPGIVCFKELGGSWESLGELKFKPDERRRFFAAFISHAESVVAKLDAGEPGL
jgi:hypothetical protein